VAAQEADPEYEEIKILLARGEEVAEKFRDSLQAIDAMKLVEEEPSPLKFLEARG